MPTLPRNHPFKPEELQLLPLNFIAKRPYLLAFPPMLLSHFQFQLLFPIIKQVWLLFLLQFGLMPLLPSLQQQLFFLQEHSFLLLLLRGLYFFIPQRLLKLLVSVAQCSPQLPIEVFIFILEPLSVILTFAFTPLTSIDESFFIPTWPLFQPPSLLFFLTFLLQFFQVLVLLLLILNSTGLLLLIFKQFQPLLTVFQVRAALIEQSFLALVIPLFVSFSLPPPLQLFDCLVGLSFWPTLSTFQPLLCFFSAFSCLSFSTYWMASYSILLTSSATCGSGSLLRPLPRARSAISRYFN